MDEKIKQKESPEMLTFISLKEASKISGHTAAHLNLLCRKKLLKGQKIGRNWNTTKKWLDDFLTTRKDFRAPQEQRIISLAAAAKISGYTAEHLNLLCRKEILQGLKIGRNWNTTEPWLADFLALDSRNAHKRKSNPDGQGKVFLKKALSIPKEKIEENKSPQSENIFYLPPAEIHPETPDAAPKNKFLWLSLTVRFSFLILIGLLFLSGAPVIRYVWKNYEFIGQRILVNVSQDAFLFSNEPGKMETAEDGKVKGETTESESGSIAMSENFRLREINFGGVLLASAEGENLPLEILDLKTKTFMSKDGKEAQALISWKSNKLAASEITYGRIDGQANKTMLEEKFGFNHNVALVNLDLDATYVFEIKARDKWDRTVLSDKFSIYTGSKIISVFDLIIKAINDTFSWAIKK